MTKAIDHQPVMRQAIELHINNLSINLSVIRREGPLTPIIFLHGFGGTKEDYVDISFNPLFAGRPFLAYDAPGSGESTMEDLSQLSMPLLVSIAEEVLSYFKISHYHLVGHSMGGLVSTLLAQRQSSSVQSYINIKGNLAPEDCFLSRQVLDYPADDPEIFIEEFIKRTRQSPLYGNGLYAASFRAKVQAATVRPTFESMVDCTDNGQLLETFEGFGFPRMYMFGEQYASLSYLPRLVQAGVELAEIPHSGHFVMYSNPVAMWERIAQFISRVEYFKGGNKR
ncbi:Alpha/Beta hydrolase protein [Mariannaea sp. PMI_226]|nr:Alpha/Beta hydrolase protein [Mariannaea sp. PMI_226]